MKKFENNVILLFLEFPLAGLEREDEGNSIFL